MSTTRKEELAIRKEIVDAGLVDCIVAMPTNLFYNVTIPVCLWFLSKNKLARKDKILFIDARNMGYMETRIHRELKAEEIKRISDTYHAWQKGQGYEDVVAFCKSATLEEVKQAEYILTPGRYVGLEVSEDDSETCERKMQQLTSELRTLLLTSRQLEMEIRTQLKGVGYDI